MSTKKKLTPSATATANNDSEKEYEAFVQGLEVIGIGLASCACDIDRGAYFDIKERVKSFSHEYELANIADNYFDAVGRFSVTVAAAKDATPAVTVRCSFLTHIHGKKPISADHAKRFANSELRLILLPYARQFVANVTSQMSIPPVIVPLTKGAVRIKE